MKRALIGAGGLASEIQSMVSDGLYFFVEDEYLSETSTLVRPLSEFNPSQFKVCVAIADPAVKKRIIESLAPETQFFTFVHPSALCYVEESKIGVGTFIGANCIVMGGVRIGRHVLLNRSNQVGHGSVIGDFFSGLPSSCISGRVLIGQGVLLGSGATILENLCVADNIVIGAMACVTRSLHAQGTYVGIPARLV